jgi:hypothetical protein
MRLLSQQSLYHSLTTQLSLQRQINLPGATAAMDVRTLSGGEERDHARGYQGLILGCKTTLIVVL